MLRKSSLLLYKRVQTFQQRQKKAPSLATAKKFSATIAGEKKAPSHAIQD